MDAALHYEPDTVVIDPEDDMQIHGDDGYWHRLTLDMNRFACGPSVNERLRQARRANSYEGSLCPLCFTHYELSESKRMTAVGSQPIPTVKER